MVDSEYSTGNTVNKYSKISIGVIMKNPGMLKFVPDHLKTEKICKHVVKKLPFVIRYVPNQCKTQQMCDIAVLENGGMLESVPDCDKIKKCVIKLLIITLMH